MFNRFLVTAAAAAAISVLTYQSARADYLSLSSLTPGTTGSFTGILGGVAVTGAITTPNPNFQFDPTGTSFFDSVTDHTSPQYSYSNIYSPSIAHTDQIGYTSFGGTLNPATITISFASPITNPVFQVANLDSMQYDFAPTAGLGGLDLLSGNNGPDGDGIKVAGTVISDGNPATIIGQDPTQPPLTFPTPRSAYGSVELLGTFTSLTINVSNPDINGDGGNFTISTSAVPEPGNIALLAASLTGCSILLRRRRK